VLYVDECHLVWQDACGYVWGPSHQRIEIPIDNLRERQTYYGAINPVTQEAIVIPFDTGNSDWTCAFLEYIRRRYDEKRLIICWDGASYHRGQEMRAYLEGVNHDCAHDQWRVLCIQFAPYAPEQNPIEDIWLRAKTHVRKHWKQCTDTFASVIALFEEGLNTATFDYEKLRMYLPDLQIK